MPDSPPAAEPCRNCGAPVDGRFCAACGQKRWRDDERSLSALLHDGLIALTDWDGRLLGSLRALLLTPGRLSADWIAGRRARWLGPIALFLLANVALFVASPMSDFDLSLREQYLQLHGDWVQARVDARLAARSIAFDDYAAAYASASGNIAKSLIVWHVPWLALALALLNGFRRWYFADHLTVSLHLFTVLIVWTMLFGWVVLPLAATWLDTSMDGGGGLRAPVLVVVLSMLLAHWISACRRVYGFGWLRCMLAVPLLLLGLQLGHYS